MSVSSDNNELMLCPNNDQHGHKFDLPYCHLCADENQCLVTGLIHDSNMKYCSECEKFFKCKVDGCTTEVVHKLGEYWDFYSEVIENYCENHLCLFCSESNGLQKQGKNQDDASNKQCIHSKINMCIPCYISEIKKLQYYTNQEMLYIILVSCLDLNSSHTAENIYMFTWEDLGHVQYKDIQIGKHHTEDRKMSYEMPFSGNHQNLDLFELRYNKALVGIKQLYNALCIVANVRTAKQCKCTNSSECCVQQLQKYHHDIINEFSEYKVCSEFNEAFARKVCHLLNKRCNAELCSIGAKLQRPIRIYVRPPLSKSNDVK